MEQIFLSVIIPVYNTERYLAECLDSIVSCEAEDVEFICINDGSTDSSERIIKSYAESDQRIRLISTENRGQSRARNIGIKAATGEYLCFLDSDDMLQNNALEEISLFARERRPDLFVYDAQCFYETKALEQLEYRSEYYCSKKEYGGPKSGTELFCELTENQDYCDSACRFCINRAWLLEKQIFFFPGMIYEDCLFCFQCLMAAEKVWHRKRAWYQYRIRSGSTVTSKESFESLSGRMTCFYEILRYLLHCEVAERVKEAIGAYTRLLLSNMRNTDFALGEKEKKKAEGWNAEKRLLAVCMDVGGNGLPEINLDMYYLGFCILLAQYDRIILYGAGKLGRMVWEYMCLEGVGEKVIAFAVSEKKEKEQKIGTAEVKGIEELQEEKGALVLLTARENFHKEMDKKARALGFEKIEGIDFRLEQMIRKKLEQRQK